MKETLIDLSKYKNKLGVKHQFIRFLWGIVWTIFAKPLPRSIGSKWKRFLLKIFGAKIDKTAVIYSSAKIYFPKNLIMKKNSCLASNVDCYNVDYVYIGENTTVSQGAFLCTASHDISDPLNHLVTAPIIIKDQAWIAAEAFIGMGVTIGQGSVLSLIHI